MDNHKEAVGYIAYYYSDQDADLPVRGIRKKWDSKADPNIETATYGLFTTCMPAARKNMVESQYSHIFFFTCWKGQRMFTGYYEIGWYLDTGFRPRANGRALSYKDYGIRARKVHFVRAGIPLTGPRWSKITLESIGGNSINAYGPRDFSKIDAAVTKKLKALLDKQSDATNDYVREIHRLEQDNLTKYGYRYPSWERKEDFREEHIRGYVI